MPRSLHILIVDDSPEDVTLIVDELRRAGLVFAHEHVSSAASLRKSLGERAWDVVLTDYTIPRFGALPAIRHVREAQPDVPVIVVAGTIDEETAVACIKNGADDYVLKDRLPRLPQAIAQALERVEDRRSRRQLDEHVRQSQKMEAIGRLAGGVAHDLNNLLTVIFGGTDQIARSLAPDTPAAANLRLIEEAATHAKNITNSLLAFCRQAPTDKRPVELASLVEDSGRLLRRLLPEAVQVAVEPFPQKVWVRADRTQLQQVLFNLAINAGDAMPHGGTLRILFSHGRAALPPSLRQVAPAEPPGETMAYLVLEDSGVGMTEEVRTRAFEPFFTTRPRGQGTGLGLAVVHGIVAEHRGAVVLDSALGHGTRVIISLPALEQHEPQPPAPPPPPGEPGTAVVAQGHAYVRGVIVSLLRSRGWTAIEAPDPESAQAALSDLGARLGLVVLDTDSTAEWGPFLDAARALPSPPPIVLMTSEERSAPDRGGRRGEVQLRKPFTLARLEQVVADARAAMRT